LVDFDGMFLNRENDSIMNFDDTQISEIVKIVKNDNSITNSKIGTVIPKGTESMGMKETIVSRMDEEKTMNKNLNTNTISYD